MANVNTAVTELLPQAGTNNDGTKIGVLGVTVKASQNDTVTITNANSVGGIIDADIRIDATGATEPYTISGNVITLTSLTTGSVRGTVLFRE